MIMCYNFPTVYVRFEHKYRAYIVRSHYIISILSIFPFISVEMAPPLLIMVDVNQ